MSHADATPCADADRAFLQSFGWPSPALVDAVLGALPPGSLPEGQPERRCWLLYALLQHTADSDRLDPLAWGTDERLAAFLDFAARGKLPADPTVLGRWLKYLPRNRAKKHTRRCRQLERLRYDIRRPEPSRPDDAAEQADDLVADRARLRSRTTERERLLLYRAYVEGLNVVAESEGMPLGTLKSLLSRCRTRLRLVC